MVVVEAGDGDPHVADDGQSSVHGDRLGFLQLVAQIPAEPDQRGGEVEDGEEERRPRPAEHKQQGLR